jgi:hypothetical protein
VTEAGWGAQQMHLRPLLLQSFVMMNHEAGLGGPAFFLCNTRKPVHHTLPDHTEYQDHTLVADKVAA